LVPRGGGERGLVSNQFPDHLKLVELPGFGGLALWYQFDNEVLSERAFRQGVAYLIDIEQVAGNTNPRHKGLSQFSGLADSVAERWLGDLYDSFTRYGVKSQPEKAQEKFREAGLSKQGGTWVKSNGKPVQLEILTPPWPGPLGLTQTVRSSMNQIGMTADLTSTEPASVVSRRTNGNFQISAWFFGGGPHPYFAYQGFTQPAYNSANGPTTAQIPYPVGDPEGSMQEINVTEKVKQLSVTTNPDKEQELVRELAWFQNQVLPVMTLTNGSVPSYISDDDWEIPSLEDDVMGFKAPCYFLLRLGQLKAKTN
jgi:ABC-type transport system substrate-binding protein